MTFVQANIDVILTIIAILSVLSLASTSPSRSALILFIEAILIDIYIGIVHGITSTVFGASLMLTFFCLIVIGGNFYLEISFKKMVSKASKLSIAIFALSFFFFWHYVKELFFVVDQSERLYFLNLNYDGLSVIIAAFALFAVLVSSLIIIELKNPKSGDQT